MAVSNNYCIYHLHSDLSNAVTNIDSVTKFKEYIDRAKECGMKAMAFSEHGTIKLIYFLPSDFNTTAPSRVQRTHKFHDLSFSRYFIILRTAFASSSGGIGLL